MSEKFNKIDREDKEFLKNVGVDLDSKERSASFTIVNNDVSEVDIQDEAAIELLSLQRAKEKHPWLKDYLWTLIDKNKDKWTKIAAENEANGYFIRVKKGRKVDYPLQACFYIKTQRFVQAVHNVIIVEEGAHLDIINGCATASYVTTGAHYGITEIFVKEGGYLSYNMIHDWGEEVEVRPRTAIKVEKNGTFISNYVALENTKITQSYPVAHLVGENSVAKFTSLVYAPPGATYDLGAKIILDAEHAKGEIISRTISGGGRIISRGYLLGAKPKIHAHLECSGMILAEGGSLYTIPELEALVDDVEMSHEAAVGKIAEEELEYLMARGLTEEEATTLIVKGFLDTKIMGLPPELEEQMENAINSLENAF